MFCLIYSSSRFCLPLFPSKLPPSSATCLPSMSWARYSGLGHRKARDRAPSPPPGSRDSSYFRILFLDRFFRPRSHSSVTHTGHHCQAGVTERVVSRRISCVRWRQRHQRESLLPSPAATVDKFVDQFGVRGLPERAGCTGGPGGQHAGCCLQADVHARRSDPLAGSGQAPSCICWVFEI